MIAFSITSCISALAFAQEDSPTSADFRNLGLAYQGFYRDNKRGPSRPEALARHLQNNERLLGFLKSGKLAFVYEISQEDVPAGEADTVIAFDKLIGAAGGAALRADGSARTLTADEFRLATIARQQEFDDVCRRNLQAILWAVICSADFR